MTFQEEMQALEANLSRVRMEFRGDHSIAAKVQRARTSEQLKEAARERAGDVDREARKP